MSDESPAVPFAAWLRATIATLEKDVPADVPCGSCNACCRTFHQIHLRPGEKRHALVSETCALLVEAASRL